MSEKLLLALNTLDSSEVWPNGWSLEKKWLKRYFKSAGKYLGSPSYKHFCQQNIYVGRDSNHPFIHEDLYDLVELSKINDDQKYIYPIRIKSYHNSIGVYSVYLPQKVIKDARAGLCKILFNELWEGHGAFYNYQKLFKKIIKHYNIPMNSVGFVDGNQLNDVFFKKSNIQSFSVLFFEHNAQGVDVFDEAKKHCNNVIQKNTILPYRFLNLNRLPKPHRSIIAQEMFLNHNDKSLWSYTTTSVDDVSKHLERFGYNNKIFTKSLPKIIDVDQTVNDNSVNFEIQKQAYINIITESIFDKTSTIFYSEKIFKPIATGQPFILVGSSNSLPKLREIGYQTYDGLINEYYDTIEDPNARIKEVIKEINRLSDMTQNEFNNLMSECYKISKHNIGVMQKRVSEKRTYNELKNNIIEWQNSS